jgi:hypothetical protein
LHAAFRADWVEALLGVLEAEVVDVSVQGQAEWINLVT